MIATLATRFHGSIAPLMPSLASKRERVGRGEIRFKKSVPTRSGLPNSGNSRRYRNVESRLRLDAIFGPDFPHQSLPRSDAGEAIDGAVLP